MAEPGYRAEVLGRWGRGLLPGEPWMRTTFLLLLLLAAVLRFWRLWDMPFMHDELSALSRLHPTLWETIRKGVMEQDTHPPGVQVFEWIWTTLFGTGNLAVKLPFVLMGLAAIWLVYRTAMAWTDATVALLVVAMLAVVQYSVLYGQLARPYAVGLFTTALCADQLTRWLAFGQRRQLVGMGVAIVLSAYTHHFALLLAGIMALTALVLITPAERKAYLLMLLTCALLYMPNLPIFWRQLGWGGLGDWLAPPDRYWVGDHLWWVAHTSVAMGLLLFGLLIWSTIRRWRSCPPERNACRLFLAWGLLPLVIALAYSAWRAPVIQHSVLLFSFPYLCIGLFTGLCGLGRRATLAVVVMVAMLGSITLITVRQHYAVAYASNYRNMIEVARHEMAKDPIGTSVWFDAQDEQLDFLLQYGVSAPPPLAHLRIRSLQGVPYRLDSLLHATRSHRLVYGEGNGAAPEQLARIQLTYGRTVKQIDLPEGRVLVLERRAASAGRTERGTHVLAKADPRQHFGGQWRVANELPVDSSGWHMDGHEYGLLCEVLLDTATTMPQDQIEVHARVVAPAGADVALVLELVQAGDNVFYRTAELARGLPAGASGEVALIVAARPEYAVYRKGGILLRAYMYNRSQGALIVRDMELALRPGNPVLYGITGPITGQWTNHP